MKKYLRSIFIFRRDYRLNDNKGLIECLKSSDTVIPIFIFTPTQLINNKYKSSNAVQFMIESLEDLDKSLKKKGSKLYLFYDEPYKVIDKLLSKLDVDAVYVNKDYTPYSEKRDNSIKKVCGIYDCEFIQIEDLLLNPISSIVNIEGNVYTKFTPYFNKAKKIKVDKIQNNTMSNYIKKLPKNITVYNGNYHKFYTYNENLLLKGGRANALKILKKIPQYKDYNKNRNILMYNTTRLSAYIKFGCISIREVYSVFKNKLSSNNDLIKQLYWRDFYYNVGYNYPVIFSKKGNLKPNYDKVKWDNNKTYYNKWKEGMTGFPVVDACMREMNCTGFMHNRGRLIVSGLLIKILLVDWKLGEKYFSQKLIDIDPSVNTGNWGWSSGSGADSQPYFRIFNPWLQSKKYDPECEYIKRWIPELKDVEPKHIHQWFIYYTEYKEYKNINYPKPIVNYTEQKQKALKMYKKIY
jgi:deoxyribodipyrimidine photo-lyase